MTNSNGLWARARQLRTEVQQAWRAAPPIRPEEWHAGNSAPRPGIGFGRSAATNDTSARVASGLSTLWQRLRWDVALRRCLITVSCCLLLGLPLPLSLLALFLLLLTLLPR